MSKLVFTFNVVLISIIFLSQLCAQNRELDLMSQFPNEIWGKIVPAEYWGKKNKKNKWFSPNSVWGIHHNIKNFRALRCVCKTLNNILTFEKIGNIRTNYDKNKKNEAFDYLIKGKSFNKDFSLLVLFCAGVDEHVKRGALLLKYAVSRNDKELAENLFQNKVDPNTRDDQLVPLFMFAQTVEMAEMFFKYGVDAHTIDPVANRNVLSVALYPKYPFELMEFYLKNGVNAELLDKNTKSCLLHQLVDQCYRDMNWCSNWYKYLSDTVHCDRDENDVDRIFVYQRNLSCWTALRQDATYKVNNFLQKGKLLFGSMSQKMINTLNKGETVVDVAQKYLEETLKRHQKFELDYVTWCYWQDGRSEDLMSIKTDEGIFALRFIKRKGNTRDCVLDEFNKKYVDELSRKYKKDHDAESFLRAIKIYLEKNEEVEEGFDSQALDFIRREAGIYEKAEALEQLINLYREYGCLTAKELEQRKLKFKKLRERMFCGNILFFLVGGLKIVSMMSAVILLKLVFNIA